MSQQPPATEPAYESVELVVNGEHVETRYYPSPHARYGVIWVPGAIGGWHSPARDLYPRLCDELRAEGISSLRVHFRNPTDLVGSVTDVLGGLAFLADEGAEHFAVVGHSFGGAVAVLAATASQRVRTVVALSTQSYGAIPAVSTLGEDCSILLIHGLDDELLPPHCSEQVHRQAMGWKKLMLLSGAHHALDEVSEQIRPAVRDWLLSELKATPQVQERPQKRTDSRAPRR